MKYSHYYTHKPFEFDEWNEATAAIREICRLASLSGVVLRDCSGEFGTAPEFGLTLITFNGSAEEYAFGDPLWIERDSHAWAYCKTGGRPYDIAVVATLSYLAARFDWDVSSDGDREDWEAGVMLAKIALPVHAKIITAPATIRVAA